jgi:hypothetical protein
MQYGRPILRWLVIVVVAHIVGSYSFGFIRMLDKRDYFGGPYLAEFLEAPINRVPEIIDATVQVFDPYSGPTALLLYVGPFAATAILLLYLSKRRRQRIGLCHGFDVLPPQPRD